MRARSVAVLGGGWAGMAAAVTLAEAGMTATVYEAARVLGGRARRVEVNGLALDNGLHILIGAYSQCLRLISLVSPDADAKMLRLPLDLHFAGEFRLRTAPLPAPLHLAAAVLWCEGLTLGERLRAAQFMARMRAARFLLDRDTTVAELMTRHRQSERTRRFLWEPLCVSALNTQPGIASAQIFLNVLRDSLNGQREDSELMLPRVDLSALFPEPAQRYVEQRGGRVFTSTSVASVQADAQELLVNAANGSERFSHVVCALPAGRVSEVLSHLPGASESIRLIAELRFEPIYSVYLQYPPTAKLAHPMLGLHGGLVQWVFDRGQLCNQPGLLGVVMSASGAHQELTHAALADAVERELRTRFPTLPAALWKQVIAEKRATFACVTGVKRPPLRTAVRRLYLAGDYTEGDYPATLEAAVRSGVAAAQMILDGDQIG